MEMKLELVPVPVTDVDRAKAFYVDKLGCVEDVDVRPFEGLRVVQVTPPGSACSIGFGTGAPVYEGGEHAFMRDVGARHDPALTDLALTEAVSFFRGRSTT